MARKKSVAAVKVETVVTARTLVRCKDIFGEDVVWDIKSTTAEVADVADCDNTPLIHVNAPCGENVYMTYDEAEAVARIILKALGKE